MNTNPLVSVVIMTVNRENMLKNAIENVFMQSYKNIELICILGMHSSDSSEDILTELRAKNMIKFNKNFGTRIDARNRAFELASGEYVCFLDDDDAMLNNRIEKQVEYLESHKDIDICSCTTMLNNQCGLMHTMKHVNHDEIIGLLNENNDIDEIVNFQSCMFRKSAIEKAFENQKKFDDLFIAGGEGQMFLYDCIFNKNMKITNISDTIYIYYVGQAKNSLSKSTEPVFYNEHLYGKPIGEKISFVKNFLTTYPVKENKNEVIIESITEAPTEPATEKPKRGRKKKAVTVEETSTTEAPKKKRGRPKKVKTE